MDGQKVRELAARNHNCPIESVKILQRDDVEQSYHARELIVGDRHPGYRYFLLVCGQNKIYSKQYFSNGFGRFVSLGYKEEERQQ